MNPEGRSLIDGAWPVRVTGLDAQQVDIAMLVTPEGYSRIELSEFLLNIHHFTSALSGILCL